MGNRALADRYDFLRSKEVNVVKGDLIDLAKRGEFDVVVHGCNCFCTMGAGIAKSIKTAFPEAYQADLATDKSDEAKLGNYSFAKHGKLVIVNAYTQYHWRGEGTKADYDAIATVFVKIAQDFPRQHIAYPKIGAGLAGGDWSIIYTLICDALINHRHTLVEYQK